MKKKCQFTMYCMSLAAGLTDDRALLCSLTHSSMNFWSVISGSMTELAAEFRIIQAHSNISPVPLILQIVKHHKKRRRGYGLWNIHLYNCHRKLHSQEEQDVLQMTFSLNSRTSFVRQKDDWSDMFEKFVSVGKLNLRDKYFRCRLH